VGYDIVFVVFSYGHAWIAARCPFCHTEKLGAMKKAVAVHVGQLRAFGNESYADFFHLAKIAILSKKQWLLGLLLSRND